MKLEGTSAVVTGAASGLGAAAAARLASLGVEVLGIDLATSIEKAAKPAGVRYAAADVTSEDEVAAALTQLDRMLPLRLAVNCAGIAPAKRVLSSKGVHDLDSFQRTININLV